MTNSFRIHSFLAFLVIQLTLNSSAYETTSESETSNPVPLSDGIPSPPAPLPVLPDFKIKSTFVREVDVVEPPPMAGLPPVTGTITETVHLVEDPQLPDPVPVPQAVVADATGESLPLEERPVQPRMLSLSATVYDHSRTLLRLRTVGTPASDVTAWSNLDFNDFSGLSTFEVKDSSGTVRRYLLIMSIGNEDTSTSPISTKDLTLPTSEIVPPPAIPTLPDGEPAYQVVSGSPDPECLQMIADLHQLYRNEGPRMKEAYLARIQAENDRRAYLLAHPPTPKNVTVYFWQRDHPVGMSADTIKKEGRN